ncbi:MAG: hypothetical protein KAY32_18115, partial [Candidatus Eisenbacteria sp.]|nr:hypothetical protein [Candidatus Eisenbacteria bacterium]
GWGLLTAYSDAVGTLRKPPEDPGNPGVRFPSITKSSAASDEDLRIARRLQRMLYEIIFSPMF